MSKTKQIKKTVEYIKANVNLFNTEELDSSNHVLLRNISGLADQLMVEIDSLKKNNRLSSGMYAIRSDLDNTQKQDSNKPIDYVTVKRLDYVLKTMFGIKLKSHIIDRIIDSVEIIEDNGENLPLDDVEGILIAAKESGLDKHQKSKELNDAIVKFIRSGFKVKASGLDAGYIAKQVFSDDE